MFERSEAHDAAFNAWSEISLDLKKVKQKVRSITLRKTPSGNQVYGSKLGEIAKKRQEILSAMEKSGITRPPFDLVKFEKVATRHMLAPHFTGAIYKMGDFLGTLASNAELRD